MAARQRGQSLGCGVVWAVRRLLLLTVTLVSLLAVGRGFVGRGAVAGANGVVGHGAPAVGPVVCEGRGQSFPSLTGRSCPAPLGPCEDTECLPYLPPDAPDVL